MNNLKMEQTVSLFPIFCAVFYVCTSIFANILSTKLVLLGFAGNMVVDAGTIIYPLGFVARDMLHKNLGRKLANQVVILNGFVIAFMALLFYIGALLPPAYQDWPHQAAFEAVLLPVRRIIIASIIAEMVANLLSGIIFGKILKANLKHDMLASFVSSLAAMLVDSVLFTLIAFAGVFPTHVLISIMVVNLVVKGLVAVAGTPLIKLAKLKVNKEDL
ncbi:MAG: queuosine precursor transporter [Spirochaetaceae bacterium]|nr:queuosine precursor transporter [Spirochaetaceae bacterium]